MISDRSQLIIDAQEDRLRDYNEDLCCLREAELILFCMQNICVEPIQAQLRPEWLVRPEMRKAYAAMIGYHGSEAANRLRAWITDPYVQRAISAVEDITSVGPDTIPGMIQTIRDGYYTRESTRVIADYINARTAKAKASNLRKLEKLDELLHVDDPYIEGLEVVDMEHRTPAIQYCLKFGDIMFCPRKELVAIKGQAKHGKSHLIEIMMAAIMHQGEVCGIDVANHTRPLRMLYVDTEQGMYSTEHIVEGAMQLAGLDTAHNFPGLDVVNLRKVSKDKRVKVIRDYVSTGKYDVCFIDGIRDLIFDFNDLEEADRLLVDVLEMIDSFDVAYVTVLHENPGGDSAKMRGHLGTEVANKAFEVFECKRIDDVFNVSNSERRSKMLPTFAFRFDEDDQLTACEPNDKETTGPSPLAPEKESKADKEHRLFMQFLKAFEDDPKLSLTETDIVRNLNKKCGMTRTTAQRRLEHYFNAGKIVRDGEGQGARYYMSPQTASEYAIMQNSAEAFLAQQQQADAAAHTEPDNEIPF